MYAEAYLETPGQCSVLFNIFSVFVQRGRTYAVKISSCKRRFKHIRCIDTPFRRTFCFLTAPSHRGGQRRRARWETDELIGGSRGITGVWDDEETGLLLFGRGKEEGGYQRPRVYEVRR